LEASAGDALMNQATPMICTPWAQWSNRAIPLDPHGGMVRELELLPASTSPLLLAARCRTELKENFRVSTIKSN
jgi:hypothetical protein